MSFINENVGAPEIGGGHKNHRKTKRVVIDDGFNSELVETAFFDGIFEIPRIEPPKEIIIPERLIPYTKRNQSKDFSEFLMFYEHDIRFSAILQNPEMFVNDFARFRGIVSPDCSLYRDMPLQAQMANTYRNRALGCFFQKHGIYVIPNVRWGDERSYTTNELPEKFAFLGIPRQSIVSIGTYGCIQGAENKYHFRAGLDAMIETLAPKVVLVYGSMPETVFSGFDRYTQFVQYPDWVALKRSGDNHGNR